MHKSLALLFCATAAPLAAQTVSSREPVPVRVASSVVALPPRPIAIYRFVNWRQPSLPASVMIADSSGVLIASFRLAGDGRAYPMTVDAVDDDVMLQGQTPAGPLAMRLTQQRRGTDTTTIAGHWWLGGDEGDLRGQIVP